MHLKVQCGKARLGFVNAAPGFSGEIVSYVLQALIVLDLWRLYGLHTDSYTSYPNV